MDLGRRMPLKTEQGVRCVHAAAVVDDLDQRPSGILDNDRNPGRSGVHGILHQFLDDG